ncbi:MAG: hypothetical protein ACOVLH_10550, partial [Roseateles sp.]
MSNTRPQPRATTALICAIALLLVGCASRGPSSEGAGVTPPPRTQAPGPQPERDGPDANPPPDLHKVPDAQPRLEPIR